MDLSIPLEHVVPCSRGFTNTHYGLDFPLPVGTPVLCAARGHVVRGSAHDDYGNLVIVYHGADQGRHWYTLYGHLASIDAAVRAGSEILAGARVGTSGNTGRSTGPHLHFEIWRAPTALSLPATGPIGVAGSVHRVNPADYLAGLPPSCRGEPG